MPPTRKGSGQLMASKTTISKESIDSLFEFTVHMNVEDDEEGTATPSAKCVKLQLSGETARNEVTCKGLREMMPKEEIVVDYGILDDTPPTYLPFNRS